nr:AlpA family phage regulatory protein [Cronobacter sakazakii]
MERNEQINNRLLRIADVIGMTGLPKSTIYLKIKRINFHHRCQ